ncbi:hypothetical protein Esti_001140 [Eimeria stiedai]
MSLRKEHSKLFTREERCLNQIVDLFSGCLLFQSAFSFIPHRLGFRASAMMQAFPASGGGPRRLAETVSASDGLAGDEFSEGPENGGNTIGSHKEAGLDGAEAIVFDRDEVHSQQSGRPDDPLEYVDKDLAGEEVPEGKTTRTTNKMKAKKARASFDAAQWTALIAAIGMLLTAGGWQLAERLELFHKEEKKTMPLPQFDLEGLGAQQVELQLNIEGLRRTWQHASERVKVAFTKKLATYMQPSEADAAFAVDLSKFEDALSPLLLPAAALRDIPVPESEGDETTLRRQVMLVNGSLTAAQVQLSVMAQLDARQKLQGDERLPTIEELKAQQADVVSAAGFLQMLAGGMHTVTEEENAEGIPRIPRVLAQAVADFVLQSELEAAAAAGKEGALRHFIEQYEGTNETPADLSIPAGGRFRTLTFINLVKLINHTRMELMTPPAEAVMRLVEDFTVDTAVEVLDQGEENASRRREVTRRLIEEAAAGTGRDGEPVVEGGSFYRTLLSLLDNSE